MKYLGLVLTILLSSQVSWADKADCEDEKQFSEISLTDLKTKISKKEVFVIDVNSEESFKEARVTGAIHYGTKRKELSKLLPKDKNKLVVAYCGGPMCGAWTKAATKACELGYKNIKHYKGGIKGWKKGA